MRRVKSNFTIVLFLTVGFGFFLSGCGAMLELGMVKAGKSPTIENTGFFKSYDELALPSESDKKAYPNLPDLYYISPKINMKAYKKVTIPDFTSRTTNINNISAHS